MTAAVEDSAAIIRDLVAFPTVSRDPNRDLLHYVEAFLARHGVSSEILWNEERTKGNLWATIGPADRPGVILSGHSDVVPVDGQEWSSDPFGLREQDGRLYGRGTCDMKGFVGIVLSLVPDLVRRDLKCPVHLAISYDEELGCSGVWSMAKRFASLTVRPALCIVGEPTSMQMITGHKGGSFHRITVEGLAAHSSLAPHGVNAIEYAAELIRHIAEISAELTASQRDEDYDVPHSTMSVTTIQGGSAFNIIPGTCSFEIDLRALPELDTAAVIRRIEEHARNILLPRMRKVSTDADIHIRTSVEYPGFTLPADHPYAAFVNRHLMRNDYAKVAYGTEAGVFSDCGIVSVVCGPGSIEQAHKPDEYLAVSEIEKCLAFLKRLTATLEKEGLPW
jgi:acetylornithine deacetylase